MVVAAAAAVAAGAVFVGGPWHNAQRPSLTAHRGWIFHEREEFDGVPYAGARRFARQVTESWQLVGDTCNERQLGRAASAVDLSATDDPGATDVYDPKTNTIYRSAGGCFGIETVMDAPKRFRSALESGSWKPSGTVRTDGRMFYRFITPDLGTTYYVDAKTFIPWRIVSTHGPPLTQRGSRVQKCHWFVDPKHPETTSTIRILDYEFLPPTAANLERLSVEPQHPDARTVSAATMPAEVQKTLDPPGCSHTQPRP